MKEPAPSIESARAKLMTHECGPVLSAHDHECGASPKKDRARTMADSGTGRRRAENLPASASSSRTALRREDRGFGRARKEEKQKARGAGGPPGSFNPA